MWSDRFPWRWREPILAAALAIAAVASFVGVRHAADAAAQRGAQQRADLAALQVEGSAARAASYVEAIRGYVVSHRSVSDSGFSSFALGLLGLADLSQVAWVQRVSAGQRRGYEASIGRPISEPRGRGLVRAPARQVFYPATLITKVLAGDLPGVDFGAFPQLRRVLGASEALFSVVATASVEVAGRSGVFFVEGAPRSERRASWPGFVVVFVPVEWLVGSLGSAHGGVEIRVGGRRIGALDESSRATSRSFTAAANRWSVLVAGGRRNATASALAWSLLGGGLALAALTLLLGAGTAVRRRTRETLLAERRHAEEQRHTQLWLYESLDGINRAIQRTGDFEQMLGAVLDVVVAVFNCDGAWLIYPCDPEVSSHRVLIERTRPEHPGALALDAEIPNEPEGAAAIRTVLASTTPVRFDPESGHALPSGLAERFSVRSMLVMAVHPRMDKPYMLGLHQCSRARIWTPPEQRLFQETGRRLGDALDTVLMFRDLRESERKIERSRAELAASRVRIVKAADEARRQIERDLHDGAQARLIHTVVSLNMARQQLTDLPGPALELLDEALAHAQRATDELRETAHGIHPAILAKGGLGPALTTLARRSAVPVELELGTAARLPAPVEVGAYYVVSEALTNIAKHANASAAHIAVAVNADALELSIRDDGRGGADPSRGSGLTGLTDRVEALGGTLHIASAHGNGTTLLVTLPLEPAERGDDGSRGTD